MVRVVCISDTHTKLNEIVIPAGDILIHAGDMCGHGTITELEDFASQFAALPHEHKIVIAGNHDWGFERNRALAEQILIRAGDITYLQDSETKAFGLRIYGSPWQPRFFDWAFNLSRGFLLKSRWEKIPTGIDVLITHGPPHGTLDLTVKGEHVGCEDLTVELQRIRPKLHVFGHIHHSYGIVEKYGTIYVNACNLNERYNVANAPVVVDLEKK